MAGGSKSLGIRNHAEFNLTGENPTTITAANELQAWLDVATVEGELNGNLECHTGHTVAISGYENNGSGLVRVTTAAQTLDTNDIITITGTTNYVGVWKITFIDGTHVDLQGSTWTDAGADVTGVLSHGDHFQILPGGDGNYQVLLAASITKGAGATTLFEAHLYVGTVFKHKIKRQLSTVDTGAFSLGALISVVEGDNVWIGIKNVSNTNDITIGEASFHLHSL